MSLPTILYLRVSQDKKKRYRSVGEQDRELRPLCDERDFEIGLVLTDNDLSASEYATKDRPDFLELRKQVTTGTWRVVAVWEASRISRVMSVYVAFRDLCRKHDVRVYVGESDRLYDFARHRDRRDFLDEGGDAEHESGKNSRRILRSVKSRAAQGLPHGRYLYGYRREYDPHSGELVRQVVDEDTAPYIREAARRVLAGEAPNSVAADFNTRGVPAPRSGQWDLTRIKRILTNPSYIAKRVYKGETYDAQWPPILDENTFRVLERKFADPRRASVKDTSAKHLLSGIAVCGALIDGKECGNPLRVMKNRGYLAYMCWRRVGTAGDGTRFHVSRRESHVDEYVLWMLFTRLSMSDAREWLASAGGDDEQRRQAREQAEALSAQLAEWERAAEALEVSASMFGRMEARLTADIEAAQARARPAHIPGAVTELIQSTPEAVAAAWQWLDFTTKREVLRSLMTIRVLPVGRGRSNVDPGESIRVSFIGRG